MAALPVTMLNFTSTFGRTFVGFVADHFGPVNTLWSVIMLSGLTQLLVWSFVSDYAGIVRTRVSSLFALQVVPCLGVVLTYVFFFLGSFSLLPTPCNFEHCGLLLRLG